VLHGVFCEGRRCSVEGASRYIRIPPATAELARVPESEAP